jgi:SAM-dependent methyltransferase
MKINNYYDNKRLDVLQIIPAGNYKKILEIGGGHFETLSLLAEQNNAEAWGVDIYPCTNKKIKFINGSIENEITEKELPNEYFDLIMANDVLEHLADSERFFKVVSDKLVNCGYLILSVPNIRQIRSIYHIYCRGTFPTLDSGLFDKTHLRWFCKKDIIKLAQKNFDLIDAKGTGRLVPNLISRSTLGEFLALQNLFVFQKK